MAGNEFVNFPIQKLLNRENFATRLEAVERRATQAKPSARAAQLGQIGQGTGNLVVDGSIVVPNRTDGIADVIIDDNGITIRNQEGAFGFEDTGGERDNIYLSSSAANDLELINQTGGAIRLRVDTATHSVLDFEFGEHASIAEVARLVMQPPSGEGLIVIGNGIALWSGRDGTETVFNNDSKDIDLRVETATHTHGFFIDGGAEYSSFFGDNSNGLLIIDNGTDKRLEIGQDHYIPTRNSSNPNVIFNEAGQDMDVIIKDAADVELLRTDAGNSRVLIRGNAIGETVSTFLGGVTVPAATTFYTTMGKDTANTTQNENPYPQAGIMSNMYVRLSTATPAGGSTVVTLQKNNVDTALAVTIPAGSANGTYSDTVNTVSYTAFDTIKWKIVNNAPAAASANLTAIGMLAIK